MAEKSNTPWTPPAGAILVEETQKQEETGWTPPSDAIPVDSDGGADMGFTKGSQEPPQQPSKPSEKNGSKPSVLVEQQLPVGVAAPKVVEKSPYQKAIDDVKQRATDSMKEAYSTLPIQQEYDRIMKENEPFILEKRAEIEQRLNSGQISEQQANEELNSYVKRISDITERRAMSSPIVVNARLKVDKQIEEKLLKDLLSLEKMQRASEEQKEFEEVGGGVQGKVRIIFNDLIDSYTDNVDKLSKLTLASIAYLYPEAAGRKEEEGANAFNEILTDKQDVNLNIKEVLDEGLKIDESAIDRRRIEESFLGGSVLGLAKSIYPMITPFQTGFFTQTFVDSYKDLDAREPETPQSQKVVYSTVEAGVAQMLERLGFRNLVGNKSVTTSLAGKVLQNAAETYGKVTPDAVRKVLEPVVKGFASEFETGMSQELLSQQIKEGFNVIANKQVFDEKSWVDEWKDGVYAGLQEGVGGGITSAPRVAANLISNKGKVTPESVDLIMEVSKDNDLLTSIETAIIDDVKKGKITEAQGDETFKNIQLQAQAAPKIPENLSPDAKAQALELVSEKEQIKKSIEGKDEALITPQKERLQQIDEQLKSIVTTAKTQEDAIQKREAEEVPVGEQPAVSEEVVEEVRKPAKPKEAEVSPEERLISIISSVSEPSLGESVGTKAFIGDTPVSIRQEGQQIVADDGVTVRELGNIDEVGNAPISQFGLKGTSTAEVEVTGPKDVIIEGKPAKILSSRVDKKGRRVVKVKDSETGLIARIKGPRAEEIAKDLALQAEKSEESLRLIEEGKPVTAPEPITEPVLKALPTEEIDSQIAALEKEVKEYEDMLVEEAETGMAVGDIEIVEVEGKPYLVKKKRGGEFSITNDKGVGVRGQERANVEAAFDNQQRRAQEQRLEEAAQEAERFKQEQGDKILEILDKAIAATDTRGRAYDATLGLPLFVFNSSLKIVRSAYKAGKSIAEAIQEAIDFLRSKGYDVNEDAYKARVTEEIGKEKAPVAEESIISEGVTVEGAPEGIYIDVEMIAGKEGRKLTPEEVLNAVPVEEVEFEVSDNNLLIKLPRELTSSEMMALMKATEQEAIGQLVDGKGKLYAQSEKFLQDYGGEFNPEFFKTPQKTQKYEKRPKAGNRIFNQPLTAVKGIADKYYKRVFGTERPTFKGINKIDETLAKRIADAYDEMINNPNDPEVKRAYEALAKETIDQYKEFTSAGYKIEINNEEPYNNAQEMIDDLRENKRMKIFSTESGFGDSPITDQQRKENPLLRDSGFKDVNGNTLLVNDVFRAIHDFYGHAELGNGFGAIGEENAWNVHARMFSPLARRAMTSETRGQNSWVNFSGVNEEAFKLRDRARELRKQGKEAEAQELVKQVYEIMKFADQKIGLLPEEFSNVSDGPVAIPTKPATKNLIDEAFKFADKSNFSNKVQFKKALQEKFEKDLPTLRKEYGIKDGNTLDENLKRYLTDAYLYETLLAIGAYPDAIGWYDYKTKAAMEIMALIHPEIKTDQNAKAIFTMALAITSNGNKVFDNFKEADRQYTYFKKNGKFDSKYSIGTQSSGIKSTFKFLNNLMENVPLDNFIDFLTTEVRAGDLYIREGGKKKNLLSGYAADTKVYGASIFGPKIGNGFFMNLFGVFDQLTMDRWFMRQYGRLTGTLLESGKDYQDKVKSNKARLEDAIKKLSDKEKKILLESVPQAKGRITKSNIDEIGKAIEKASAKKDIRKKLSSTEKLNEVRKAGNSLAGVLSGEVEAPTAAKREFIISIFDDVQKRLKDEYGIDMTIADLQAVNWYPEKSLYKAFKEDQSAESAATETSDNEQPDYESAAKKLAVELYNISPEKIENATRGITERGQSIAESNRRRVEEFSGENQGDNQRAIRETIIKIKKGSELSPTEKLMDSYKTWTIKTKCQ